MFNTHYLVRTKSKNTICWGFQEIKNIRILAVLGSKLRLKGE